MLLQDVSSGFDSSGAGGRAQRCLFWQGYKGSKDLLPGFAEAPSAASLLVRISYPDKISTRMPVVAVFAELLSPQVKPGLTLRVQDPRPNMKHPDLKPKW